MKAKGMLLLFSIMFLLAGSAAFASSEDIESESESETEPDYLIWTQYRLQIDEEVYTFPMTMDRFTGRGWTGGTDGGTLEPFKYERYLFRRDDQTCSAYLYNPSDQTLPLDECLVGGIVIEEHDWADLDCKITLPGDIIRGVSTGEDILEAYGEPSELCEGSLYTIYSYREDIDREVELEVYNTSGLLHNIRIENFAESKAPAYPAETEETPSLVLSYVKPESLSESLTEYEIELEGLVYSLPVPVSALIEDGWELDSDLSDQEIPGDYFGWVTLRQGDLSITQSVMNPEDTALAPENCWLEFLQVDARDKDVTGSLPGGVKIGMNENRFLSLLEENEMSYELSENGKEICYTYNSNGFGHDCEVIFLDGRAVSIACENAIDN